MERAAWVDKMVECIASPDAHSVRATEAIDLKYANRPKSVFKYRAVDGKGYSLQNLENDCVWVCSPTAYNDPYDSSLSIESDILIKVWAKDAVRSILEIDLAGYIDPANRAEILESKNPGLELQKHFMLQDGLTEEQQAELKEMLRVNIDTLQRRAERMLPESYKPSLKICSFSETPDSIIMWSHYGDQHHGFCIEYRVEELPPGEIFVRLLFPVVYSESLFDGTKYYQAASINHKGVNLLFPALAALHKSPEWSYEREWRLVIPAGLQKEATGWRVPKPKAVYLGSLMSEENRAKVIEICRRRGIDLRQMRLERNSFSLTSEPVGEDDRMITT
jgi:Protein of unknown function (DUF2971)